MWLDRGELDKLLVKADDDWDDDDRGRRQPQGRREPDRHDEYPGRKKKKGWMSEMFDFD